MSYTPTRHFSVVSLAAAAAITMSLNGAMLIGFDQLAKSPQATTVSQWVKADGVAKQVTLPRVVISARRA
ncbi:hypothetical protein [Rhodoferax sp.]|uniref:hypothetical protein n=1 Tax=Rhodoferax sp. TaxID=50421 RepID=UPI00275748AF|nr:hypothetical protein [Rhodoferax sp.]